MASLCSGKNQTFYSQVDFFQAPRHEVKETNNVSDSNKRQSLLVDAYQEEPENQVTPQTKAGLEFYRRKGRVCVLVVFPGLHF